MKDIVLIALGVLPCVAAITGATVILLNGGDTGWGWLLVVAAICVPTKIRW